MRSVSVQPHSPCSGGGLLLREGCCDVDFAKKMLILLIGCILATGAGDDVFAQNETQGKEKQEAKKLIIEFRNGTRQIIVLDKEWWHILNILMPATPAPSLDETAGKPAVKSPVIPEIRNVILDVSGKWINWRTGGKRLYTMRLIQEGRRVRGLHRLDTNYVLDGLIEGNVLKGTWASPGGVGEFLFEFSEDGRSFRGRWNTTKNLNIWESGWNGRRE